MQKTVHGTILTLSVELAKWLQTTLLAVNGAAAIATFPVVMPPLFKVASCGIFVFGILLALLSGHLQTKIITQLLNISGETIGYWFSVSMDGERLEKMEKEQAVAPAKAAKAVGARVCGWGSAGMFALGAIIAGWGGLAPSKPEAQLLQVHQHPDTEKNSTQRSNPR